MVGVGGYGAYKYQSGGSLFTPTKFEPTKEDYQKVYDEIAKLLVEKDDYDDGSYGPVRNFPISDLCLSNVESVTGVLMVE